MKGIIFCLIILIWTISVLHSKSYLVEVDDNHQGDRNQDTAAAETPADQEEGIDEDEVDVEDINDDDDETEGILVFFFIYNKVIIIEGTDYQARTTCMRCGERKPGKMEICKKKCCGACLTRRKTRKGKRNCLEKRGLDLQEDCDYKLFWK